MKKLLLIPLLFIFANCYAVTGYKQFKFGMTEDEVRATKVCGFRLSGNTAYQGITGFSCYDFRPYPGLTTTAHFIFADKKLRRVVVLYSFSLLDKIAVDLKRKHGPAQDILTQDEVNELAYNPNKTAWIHFDNKSVSMKLYTDANTQLHFAVLYSDENYDVIVQTTRDSYKFQKNLK